MKNHTPLIITALLASLITGCSRHSPPEGVSGLEVADIGIVDVSDGIPVCHDLGRNRTCVITPTVLKSNTVRLAITIQETNSAGVVQPVAKTKVDLKAGKTNQISIGDNFDIRLMPQIKQ